VGFEAHNIFKVYNATSRKVVAVRDVKIDETVLYGNSDENKKSLSIEELENTVIEFSQQRQTRVRYSLAWPVALPHIQDDGDQFRDAEDTPQRVEDRDNDDVSSPETPQSSDTDREQTPASETTVSTVSKTKGAPRGPRTEGLDQSNVITAGRTRRQTSKQPASSMQLAMSAVDHLVPMLSTFLNADDKANPMRLDNEDYVPYQQNYAYLSIADATADPTTVRYQKDMPKPPTSWKQMLKHPERDAFLRAVKKEIKKLLDKNTWIVIKRLDIPRRITKWKTIPLKWVFDYKFDENNKLLSHKARLVARGDMQRDINPYQDVYAATVTSRHFRAMTAKIAHEDLEAESFDAINAYLNAGLSDGEEFYVTPPQGWEWLLDDVDEGDLLLLQRALYGLRVSAQKWYNEIITKLRRLGYRNVVEEPCLWMHPVEYGFVYFHVDDFHACGTHAGVAAVRRDITTEWEMRSLGEISWFLGIRIVRDRAAKAIYLCQDAYIDKVCAEYDILPSKQNTPISGSRKLQRYEGQASTKDTHTMQRYVGSAIWASTQTRPDITKATGIVAENMKNPSADHIAAARDILGWLAKTRTYALKFTTADPTADAPLHLYFAAADASYGDGPGYVSSSGYVIMFLGGPIEWKASRQRMVTLSSTESEFVALTDCTKIVLEFNRFLQNLGYTLDENTPIQCDNKQTVMLVTKQDEQLVSKLKHVNIRQSFIRQTVADPTLKVRVYWVSSEDMIADGLTKLLDARKHAIFMKQMRLVDISNLI
jgi:hypothetical protein